MALSGNEIPDFIKSFDAHVSSAVEVTLQAVKTRRAKGRDPALSRGDELSLLALENENAFSDWLAWLLQRNGSRTALGNRICEIFGGEFREGQAFFVEREV